MCLKACINQTFLKNKYLLYVGTRLLPFGSLDRIYTLFVCGNHILSSFLPSLASCLFSSPRGRAFLNDAIGFASATVIVFFFILFIKGKILTSYLLSDNKRILTCSILPQKKKNDRKKELKYEWEGAIGDNFSSNNMEFVNKNCWA